MRMARYAVLGSLLMACGDDGAPVDSATEGSTEGSTGAATDGSATVGTTGEEITFCAGPTALLYDPLAGRIDALPDDVFTVDADTQSGVRIDLRPGENVVLEGNAMSFTRVFDAASTVDGFGTTAGFYMQLSGPLDGSTLPESGSGMAAADDALVLVDLDADPPQLVPFSWRQVAEAPSDPRTTLVIEPMVPLQQMHRYAVAMTNDALDADGMCVSPSPTMQQLLLRQATDPVLTRVHGRYDDAIAALIDAGTIGSVQELSALFVYTTQHTTADSAAIAQEIRAAAAPTYVAADDCVGMMPPGDFVACQGSFDVVDYTGIDEAVPDDLMAQGGYTLPVTIWLPTSGTPPFPTLVYGHGLAGDRTEAEALAEFATPQGWAVVAVPAPKHGEHPDSGGVAVLEFFGLSLNLDDPLDPLKLRDNFRQGTYDRLQLVQMLLAGVDADGDAEVDLDPDRLAYLGVSLGGIMGPELMAFAPELRAGVLIVPGARVSGIVAEGDSFATIIDFFASMATDGEVARFFPLLQSVIDRGDAGVYAPHVFGDRLEGFDDARPQVLAQMVLQDDTVPNSANLFYARAMGVPLVGDELLPIGIVPHEPQLPTSANIDADVTAGMFQFDVLADGTSMAGHSNIARDQVAQTQILHFLQTHLDANVAEILDPYRELGIKP